MSLFTSYSALRLSQNDILPLSLWLIPKFILILFFYANTTVIFNGDSDLYEGLARNILSTGQYHFEPYEPYSGMFRPPAYPFIIALVYIIFGIGAYLPLLLTNLIGCFFLYTGIRALFERLELPHFRFMFLFLSFDLGWNLYAKEILTEPFFTPLLVWCILLLHDGIKDITPKKVVLSGILLGIATLFKPITLYLPLLLIPFVFYWASHRLRYTVYFLLPFLLLTSGWMLRNYHAYNSFNFTSIQSRNLLYAHAAFVLSDFYDIPHRAAHDSIDVKLQPRLANKEDQFVHWNTEMAQLAKEILTEHPFLYGKAIIRGMVITLIDPGRLVLNRTFPLTSTTEIGLTNIIASKGLWGTYVHLWQTWPQHAVVLSVYAVFLLVLSCLSLIGLYILLRHRLITQPLLALLVLVFFYLLVLGGPNGYARFRLYLFPYLLCFSTYGLMILQQVVLLLVVRWRTKFTGIA